jgi:hypothetical protein
MTGLFSFLIKKVSKFATENVSAHGVLPLKLVVNAVSTRVLLQFFFPESALCPIFFTLTFLDMIWVHVIHVLGMLGVLGGYITCFKIGKKKFNLPQVTNKCSNLWPCIGPKDDKMMP